MNPKTFAAELEALVAKYGEHLNDNEVISALEAQLTRAWADACEPQPAGLFAAAPELLEALSELLETVDAQIAAGLRWDAETVQRARLIRAKATGAA